VVTKKGLAIFAVLFVVLSVVVLGQVPDSGTLPIRLLNGTAGNASQGTFEINTSYYGVPTGGSPLFESLQNVSTDSNGIGSIVVRNTAIDYDQNLYLTFRVDGEDEMTPRINISPVPQAQRAINATFADEAGTITGTITESQVSDLSHTVDTFNTTEQIQDSAWDVVGGTQTGITVTYHTVTYQDGTDDVDFVLPAANTVITSLANMVVALLGFNVTGGVNVTGDLDVGGAITGDGSGLTGVSATNVSGNASNASFAIEAGTLTGKNFNTSEEFEDNTGNMLTGNTETGLAVTYQDGDSTIDFILDAVNSVINAFTLMIHARDGLNVTGNVNITGLLNVSGDVQSQGVFIGDGSSLTGVSATNVSGNASNASYAIEAGSLTGTITESQVSDLSHTVDTFNTTEQKRQSN